MFTVFQGQYDKLEAKFFEERAALEDKYHKLYEPLCSKVSLFVYWYNDAIAYVYVVAKFISNFWTAW